MCRFCKAQNAMQRNVWCRALQSGTVMTPPTVFGSAIKCAVPCNVGASASCSRVLMPHPAPLFVPPGGVGAPLGHLCHRHKESILSFHVNLTFEWCKSSIVSIAHNHRKSHHIGFGFLYCLRVWGTKSVKVEHSQKSWMRSSGPEFCLLPVSFYHMYGL